MKHAQILDEKIRSIARREREALGELIIELKQLDSIRGYEQLGFASLFDYLTKAVGYSAGAAQRRIDAARLLKSVPTLSEKLQSGALDLHHVTTVSKAIRQTQKKRKVSAEEKRTILEQLEAKPQNETQQAVAQFFELPVMTSTKKSIQQDKSVRLEITLSAEVAKLIEEAQALISHSVPTQNLADFLEYVALKIIKQKRGVSKSLKGVGDLKSSGEPRPLQDQNSPEAPVKQLSGLTNLNIKPLAKTVTKLNLNTTSRPKLSDNLNSRVKKVPRVGSSAAKKIKSHILPNKAIPIGVQRHIRTLQPACAKCNSTWFLQTDHKKSKWAGGTHEILNLQTLCGVCNRRKYRLESGVKRNEYTNLNVNR